MNIVKKLGLVGVMMLVAAPVFAEEVPQKAAPNPTPYNCDFQPACEVAPGKYGKMYSPVRSKFQLSIGGYVKLDYAYNSENFGTSGALSPATGAAPSKALTATSAAANQDQSILSLRQTRLWLKVDGPTFLGAKTSSLIEGDFYGDNSAAVESPMFRMRLGYGVLDWANTQILFGQAYDMFAPMIANTQDFRSGAPYGTPNTPRIPQIRLTHRININSGNEVRLVAAVEDPAQLGNNQTTSGGYGSNLNYTGQLTYVNKTVGVAPGYFGLSMNPLSVTFFGQFGSERAANNNKRLNSYGYGVYAFVPVLKSKNGMNRTMTMSLEAQAYKAANMAYSGATWTTVTGTGVPSDTFSKPNPGALNTATDQMSAQNWAATTQVIFYPTEDLGLTAGWGSRYAYDITKYQGFTNYARQTQEIYASAAYDLNAAVRLAAEYQNFKTVYGNANGTPGEHATGIDNTVRLAAYYFF